MSYTYTTEGRLETRTWARMDGADPLVTTYTYDPATAELTTIDYSDATPDITFTYDRLGRQQTITDAVGTRTFGYNPQLQLETETITGLYDRIITRTYDTVNVPGRSTGFTLGPDYSVIYGYEPATGRFASIDWTASGVTDIATYTYVPNSDLLYNLTTDSGLLTSYSYESNRNLRTQIKNEFNAQLISQYNYVYNELGLRDSVDTIGPAFSGVTVIPMGQTTTYTPNTLNQYTDITTDNGPLTTNTLFYDDDGNLTSVSSASSVREYVYNAENRLITVQPQTPVDGDTKVEFVYDYMGRRVQKKVYTFVTDTWTLTTDTLFVYDGWNVVEEYRPLIPDPRSLYYIWGLDLSQSFQGAGGIGGLIASIDTSMSKMYNYVYDANGNVTQLVDTSDGSIAALYEYDPFGKMLHASGSLANENPFKFSTKYYDTETNLYYYGYRFYSPNLGRWINRDPIGEKGGKNLYIYCSNNGINKFDSLGRLDGGHQPLPIGDEAVLSLLFHDYEGKYLFKRWLYGDGTPLIGGNEWGAYLEKSPLFTVAMKVKLSNYASEYLAQQGPGTYTLFKRFHVQIENGYSSGHELLSGTNELKGNFQIEGTLGIDSCNAKYDVEFRWNDIIDPNPEQYPGDIIAEAIAEHIFGEEGTDYDVRIYWRKKINMFRKAGYWDSDSWPFK